MESLFIGFKRGFELKRVEVEEINKEIKKEKTY